MIEQVNLVKTRKNERENELFAQIETLQEKVSKWEKLDEQEEQSVNWATPPSSQKHSGTQIQSTTVSSRKTTSPLHMRRTGFLFQLIVLS